jgi:hypothetical protein
VAPLGGVVLLAPGCDQGVTRCENMAPGTYETSGTWAFLRGLTVTLPAGWSSSEQDAGEFNLHLATDPAPASAIFFWKDLVPWRDGAARPELGTSADQFADYLLGDPRFTVVEGPGRTFDVRGPDSLAPTGFVQARSLSVIVSASAKSDADVASDCTEVCVNVLTDPDHWGGEPVNLGRNIDAPAPDCPCSHAWRVYIASIGRDLHPHTFVVVEEAVGRDPLQALSVWEPQADPIVDSVLVPYIVVDN